MSSACSIYEWKSSRLEMKAETSVVKAARSEGTVLKWSYV